MGERAELGILNEEEVGLDSVGDESVQVIKDGEGSIEGGVRDDKAVLSLDPISIRHLVQVVTNGTGTSISGREPYALT